MGQVWYGRTRAITRPPIVQMRALAEELSVRGRDILDLGQAVVAVEPPVGVREALAGAHPVPLYRYTPDPGLPELREALAEWFQGCMGASNAGPEHVLVTCGANQAFANLLFALTRPGDKVVLLGPSYFDHDYVVLLAGCRLILVPLVIREGYYQPWLRGIERELAAGARVVVLVNPSNPTGATFPREQVEALVELCIDWKAWLVADETYAELVYEPYEHASAAQWVHGGRVAVVGSFSKTYALAGLRVGWLFGPEVLVQETVKVQDAFVVCAPVPSQYAALAALRARTGYLPALRKELARRRRALLEALEGWPLGTAMPSQGATFVFVRLEEEAMRAAGYGRLIDEEGPDDVAFCGELLRRTGLLAVPGSAFGPHGRGFLRLSFGNQPAEVLARVGDRLAGMCG